MTAYDLTTFGDPQIRLTDPSGDRLATCRELRLTPAGSEANVAGLLAQLGRRTAFTSVIPYGDLAQRFIDEYRGVGVDLSHSVRCEGRMALYFMEPGDPPLPAKVSRMSKVCEFGHSNFGFDSSFELRHSDFTRDPRSALRAAGLTG